MRTKLPWNSVQNPVHIILNLHGKISIFPSFHFVLIWSDLIYLFDLFDLICFLVLVDRNVSSLNMGNNASFDSREIWTIFECVVVLVLVMIFHPSRFVFFCLWFCCNWLCVMVLFYLFVLYFSVLSTVLFHQFSSPLLCVFTVRGVGVGVGVSYGTSRGNLFILEAPHWRATTAECQGWQELR